MKTTSIKPSAMPFSPSTQTASGENNKVSPPPGYWRLAWQNQQGANSVLFEQRAV